jgi:hypothetical protein
MYATSTVNHTSMSEDLSEKGGDGQYVTVHTGRVSAHLGDLYLSFTPDEAERLANALLVNAVRARVEIEHATKVEEAPTGFFNGDDITLVS